MRLAFALILTLLSTVAGWARPVVVTSGEHKDFTRIVLQFAGKSDWQFGRTLDGYAFHLPGEAAEYDLGKAFDLIGRTRVASLDVDPASGDLRIGLACACHALPFEFRPGIVVIDLHDGAAPPGSSFEQPLAADAAPVVGSADGATPPAPTPEGMTPPDGEALVTGYDWTKLSLEQMGLAPGQPVHEAKTTPEAPLPESVNPNLDRLREALVQEMGQGASAGLIDLALPSQDAGTTAEVPPPAAESPTPPDGPASAEGQDTAEQMLRTHLGETPEIALRDVGEPGPALTAQGATCLPDDALDVAAWGSDRPVAEQIGPIRQGIVGEFDKPSAEAVKRVVRFYLFIGFGAEAKALLDAYPDLLPEADVWRSMADILDGEPAKAHAFDGMEDCDTPAALWAVLANPKALPRDEVGRSALARNFSALPAHLRRLLGPGLVEAFLDAKDIAVATTLSEAVLRAPGEAGPEVTMMQADMDRALGHAGQAEAKLEPLAAAPGPASADALVDLVEHRAMLGQRVSEEEVMTLEAALKEREGSAEEPRYRRAVVLAKAASGDFEAAFTGAEDRETKIAIWRLLAQGGGDTPLLNHAVLAEGQAAPEEARDSAGMIADRLLMLGLADQAARWLALAPQAPDMLKARVALANGDTQSALDLLKDDGSEKAMHLKAQALLDQGDQAGAARIYAELGRSEQQWATLSAAQSWDQIAKDGPEQWKSVADIVAGTAAPAAPAAAPTGVLGQDKQLVDDSSSTRDAITNLLNSVQVPGQPSQ